MWMCVCGGENVMENMVGYVLLDAEGVKRGMCKVRDDSVMITPVAD